MCRNGQYTERGIKEIHGFMSEHWRTEPEYTIKVDPSLGILGVLLEPMTVITKALEQVLMVGQRSFWEPRSVLVTGAGPIGLLAALRLSVRDLAVHVLIVLKPGRSPNSCAPWGDVSLWKRVGSRLEPDIIVECTGVGSVIEDAIEKIAGGIICLTGVGTGGIASRA
jgi:threonine dehydrogenase-like Zn-dependent dehydrogenase